MPEAALTDFSIRGVKPQPCRRRPAGTAKRQRANQRFLYFETHCSVIHAEDGEGKVVLNISSDLCFNSLLFAVIKERAVFFFCTSRCKIPFPLFQERVPTLASSARPTCFRKMLRSLFSLMKCSCRRFRRLSAPVWVPILTMRSSVMSTFSLFEEDIHTVQRNPVVVKRKCDNAAVR